MRSVPATARTILLLLASSAMACAAETGAPKPAVDSNDPLASADDHLTALSTACTFNASTGAMVVSIADGETAILSKRAADSAILQNGQPCTTAVTAATLKKITVTGTTGDQKLILDFTNGVFATGTSSVAASGISVDMKGGNDEIGVRGTSAADSFTWGTNATTAAKQLLVNNDAFVDTSVKAYANLSFIVSMGDGDDTISTAGSTAAGNAFGQNIQLFGGNGNDTFAQGTAKSQETMDGGAGTDTVTYASRSAVVTVTAGAGSTDDGESGESDDVAANIEVITGGSAADVLTAAAGGSTLNGGAGDDTLTGAAGNDTINGGAGADTIDGKDGNDTIDGGDDNDTIVEGTASNGGDVIGGGAGVDVVDYSGRTVALTVTMDGKAADDGESNEKDNVKADVENLLGGSGDDTITGNDLANRITGNGGKDTMTGGAGDDVFDMLAAADGADTVHGGLGVDLVDYSARTGDVIAALDNTTASGEASEGDKLDVDVENLWGGGGNDTLTGNALNNEIIGGVGDDTLNGGAGDDVLEGGAVGNTESNALDCGTGDGDIGMNEGSGTKVNCEF